MISQGEGCREDVGGGGGGMAAHTSNISQKKNHQLHRNVFAPRGGGGKRRGPMPLGLFLLPRRQDGV